MTARDIIALCICGIINKVLGMRVTEVHPHHRLDEDLAVESIDTVTITMEIEDLFGIQLTDDELEQNPPVTVLDWIDLTERKIEEAQS